MRVRFRKIWTSGIAAALAAASATLFSHAQAPAGTGTPAKAGAVKREEALRHLLPDLPGKEVTVVTISYPPGAGSPPHRHPGSVVGYVLEGALVMQMDGHPPVTYHAGQSFYEAPNQLHAVSRNASTTRPARLLAFVITGQGQPITLPAEGAR
jgi:quercetin dioxygenase-like cupin family protein